VRQRDNPTALMTKRLFAWQNYYEVADGLMGVIRRWSLFIWRL